jgi:hypothetical protein
VDISSQNFNTPVAVSILIYNVFIVWSVFEVSALSPTSCSDFILNGDVASKSSSSSEFTKANGEVLKKKK